MQSCPILLSKFDNKTISNTKHRNMAYKQRWLEYFDVLDADKSGFIDEGDLSYLTKVVTKSFNKPADSPEVKLAAESISSFFHSIIREFDANKDGKVSKEELLAGVEKFFIGKTADNLPEWWSKNINGFFSNLDGDKDGEVTVEEYIAFMKRIDPSATEEQIKQAYNWGLTLSTSGKFNLDTFSRIVFAWATSPDPTPEASLILVYIRHH